MDDPFDRRILGLSPHTRALRDFGRRAATVDAPVLITGETGTGKGILAQAIHDAGARARAPFIAVNCAGIPESLFESEFFGHVRGAFTGALQAHRGYFEQADRGTLFLDEIGELPFSMQAKLLTVLENGIVRKVGGEQTITVDARIIAATAVPLEQRVRDRSFRRDLYHRLRVLFVALPSLSSRWRDILPLTNHFITIYSERYQRAPLQLTDSAAQCLNSHDWPGNIRELANTIHGALLLADSARLDADTLLRYWDALSDRPGGAAGNGPGPSDLRAVLQREGGNITRAARALGISRNTLRKRLRTPDPTGHSMDASGQ